MTDREYKVGYRKPPVEHRFKPGHSGNRSGRPRQSKNLKTLFLEEAAALIIVNEGGKTRRITKGEALVKRLFADALGGKNRAMNQLLQLLARLQADTYESPEEIARQIHEYVRAMDANVRGESLEHRWRESEEEYQRELASPAPAEEPDPADSNE